MLVWRRHPGQYASASPMVEGRDFFVDELLADYRGAVVEPVSMPAEAPLFLMYTSGTTGQPKGCQHSTGGYLAYVAGTSKYYQDIHPDDTYWCFADIGWITGHSYIVYGPLALGTTSVMYEGVPTYPDAGPALADRRAARREHLPHRADDDPDAAQARPGRAGQVQLPLQAHDHGRRADRAGGLALVPRRGRQGRGGHRRHLVADRERRLPRQHAARAAADEAGQLRPGRARHLPGDLRRGTATWSRPAAARRATSASATRGPASSRPSGASPSGSSRPTTRSTAGTRTARTGATGRTSPATAPSRPRTATSASSAASTT